MLPLTQPAAAELEVTLIGPGYGECVLIHVHGEWVVIDSCRLPTTKQAAAIAYLSSIGIPFERIRMVACTHWHDDHSAGISDTFSAAPNAELCLSSALDGDEFAELIAKVQQYQADPGAETSGLSELTSCMDVALGRGRAPIFATHDQCIWASQSRDARLYALSPSPAMRMNSLRALASLMPSPWTMQRRIVMTENHVAVAMQLNVGTRVSVLLGSDLEETGQPDEGWSAVISSKRRPEGSSSLYKVAHHGSVTAHHDDIWRVLLADKPASILTPFSKLTHPLPRAADRERIRLRSSRAFLTTDVLERRIKRRGALAKAINKNNVRLLYPSVGAVRCRIDTSVDGATWQIERSEEVVEV